MKFLFSVILFSVFLVKAKTFAVEMSASYVGVGCYADKSSTSRPLPDLLDNFYFSMTWNTIDEVVKRCSKLAQSKGHRYFGLQQYGECWSGKDAELTYARDGSSDDCVKGVGKTGANFIYKFVNSLDQSCDLGWYTANDKCFHISYNSSFINSAQADHYCTSYRGRLFLTNSSADFLVQDRFIKSLELNKKLNTTDCLVLSPTSLSYSGVLPPWNESRDAVLAGGRTASSLGTSYECAVKDVNGKWYHNKCDLKDCRVVCSRQRDIQPAQGSFRMVRRNTAFQNNLLMWKLVDDVSECARECLVTDTCASFKYGYKPSVGNVGYLCGLSLKKMIVSDLEESDFFNYYERLR